MLGIYDLLVLGLSNPLLWRCPTPAIVALYDRHVSDRHLDVGVGTGYFLDRCRFPSPSPTVALLDLNENALRYTEDRIRRYRPVSYVANVLEPVDVDLAPFRSIGVNYVLHCLPGDMRAKARVFAHLRPLLAEGGVLFGSTILGAGVSPSAPARALMGFYNRRGIFDNREDTREGLEAALAASFREHEVTLRGCVALFTARA